MKLYIYETFENTANNIMGSMSNIDYGWVGIDGNIHKGDDFDSFYLDYILQSPEQVLDNNIGVCWDQVELERSLFEQYGIPYKTFFIEYNDGEGKPSHTFLLYYDNGKCYWFEHSWYDFKGIHVYENEEESLLDIKDKFIRSTETELGTECDLDLFHLYEYNKPEYGINCNDFYTFCETTGKEIDVQ